MEAKILTKEILKEIIKNESCIKAMTAVFEAMAFCETIRDIVEPKQQEVVDFYKFKVRDDFKESRGIEIVTTYKQLYMADESDWKLFGREMAAFYKEKGLKHKEDCCPLLEAESLVREIKRCAIIVLEPFTGVSWDRLSWNLMAYQKYIELQLALFAPIIKNNLN